MSRHWKPDDELARALSAQKGKSWPPGATAGLVLIAAACLGLAVVLYQVAAPRDVFEEEAAQ